MYVRIGKILDYNRYKIFEKLNIQDYKLSLRAEYFELTLYSLICFFVPFFIGNPQLVVGIIVNASLVLSALNLKSKMLFPSIMLPSLAVLSRGIIFGHFTYFLIFMIPFIWIGNAILVYCFKKLRLENKKNMMFVIVFGATIKSIFIFSAAFALYKFNLVPSIFLMTMGLFQFYTAVAGGIFATGIHNAKKYLMNEK